MGCAACPSMKNIHRILCCGALAAITAFHPMNASAQTFSDVPPSHWAATQIERAVKEGVASGTYRDNTDAVRLFSPDQQLTMPQLLTFAARMFFPEETAAMHRKHFWYEGSFSVSSMYGLTDGIEEPENLTEKTATRYHLVQIMANVLDAKGLYLLDEQTISQAETRIPDWVSIPEQIKPAVAKLYSLGIITGLDDTHTFGGEKEVTRAQALTALFRLKDFVKNNPSEKVDASSVLPPATVDKHSDLVGQLSEVPVCLSLSTHAPTEDYWSTASPLVQRAADRDAFNAAVNTIRNREKQAFEIGEIQANPLFHYACFEWEPKSEKITKVTHSLAEIGGYGTYYVARDIPGADNSDVAAIVYAEPRAKEYGLLFDEVLAQATLAATEEKRIALCVEAVTNRFDYDDTHQGSFTWFSDNKKGVCLHFTQTTGTLLSAMGIPSFSYSGETREGLHAWNMVHINGSWMVVDTTAAENGWPALMTIEEHQLLYGYERAVYETERFEISKALIESASS